MINLIYRSYAETLTADNPKTADNYHYFSYDTKAGTAGIARTLSFGGGKGKGSFCLPEKDKKLRTAITEWMKSDAKTSLVRLFFLFFWYLSLPKAFQSKRRLKMCIVCFLDIRT